MAILTTTQRRRDAWAAAGYVGTCRSGVWENLLFFDRGIGGVPRPLVDGYRALEIVLRTTGYTPKSRWAYNFRKITGGSKPCACSNYDGCSPHAFGIAIDIDPAENPYTSTAFSWSRTKFTSIQIEAIEAIENTKSEQFWQWGGRWSSVRDYMHFEVQVDPSSVAINWSTVQGSGGSAPGGSIGGSNMGLFLGLDIGKVGEAVKPFDAAVSELQIVLTRLGHDTKGVDGRAGNNTRNALISFQKANRIDKPELESGVIGAYTDAEFVLAGGGGGMSQTQADARYAPKAHSHSASVKLT